MNKTNSQQNGEANTETNSLKTFSIYHVERNNDGYDEYYKGVIEAKNMDEAIEIVKDEFIPKEYLKDVFEDGNDENETFIEYLTEFFDGNGNVTEQNEEDDDQGFLQHCIRIVLDEVDE